MTCLVYHVNEGLGIVLWKATDGVTQVFAREDLLNQGGDFMQDELACD